MTYEQYLRKLFKSPLSLTISIIMSTMVFFQFIALFVGRWIDLVEFGANVFLVVIVWTLFARCVSTKNKKLSSSLTCTFAWTIVKLISLGMAAIGILTVGIYTCVKAGKSGYKGQMIAAGLILLFIGLAIYIFRILACIYALIEIRQAKNAGTVYVLKKNWFVILIVLAGLRLAGLILQIIYAGLAGKGMYVLKCGMLDLFGVYGVGRSKFAGLIYGSISIGSTVFVVLTDLMYIAVFVILAIIMSKYRKALNM